MSGCGDVCLDHGFEEPVDLYSEMIVTARGRWSCCECHEFIEPGQRYQYAKGLCDGSWFMERTCLICAEIRKVFVCGSWIFGELWESIRQEMFPVWETKGPMDCLIKLENPEARDKCFQRVNTARLELEASL